VTVGSASVGAVRDGAVTDGKAALDSVTLGCGVGSETDPLPEQAARTGRTRRVVTKADARLMHDSPRSTPVNGVTHRG